MMILAYDDIYQRPYVLDESRGTYFKGDVLTERFIERVADDILNGDYTKSNTKNDLMDWGETYRGSLIKYTNRGYDNYLLRYDNSEIGWVFTVDVIIVKNIDNTDTENCGDAFFDINSLEYGATKLKHCGIMIKNPSDDKRLLMGAIGRELRRFYDDFQLYKDYFDKSRLYYEKINSFNHSTYFLPTFSEAKMKSFEKSLSSNDWKLSLREAFATLCYYLKDDEIMYNSESIYRYMLDYSKTHDELYYREFISICESYRLYVYVERMINDIFNLSENKSREFIAENGCFIQDAFKMMESFRDAHSFMRRCPKQTVNNIENLSLKDIANKLRNKLAVFSKETRKQWYYLKEK